MCPVLEPDTLMVEALLGINCFISHRPIPSPCPPFLSSGLKSDPSSRQEDKNAVAMLDIVTILVANDIHDFLGDIEHL